MAFYEMEWREGSMHAYTSVYLSLYREARSSHQCQVTVSKDEGLIQTISLHLSFMIPESQVVIGTHAQPIIFPHQAPLALNPSDREEREKDPSAPSSSNQINEPSIAFRPLPSDPACILPGLPRKKHRDPCQYFFMMRTR